MGPFRFRGDFNKLLDQIDDRPFFEEELIEPERESLEDYLVRKRTYKAEKKGVKRQ